MPKPFSYARGQVVALRVTVVDDHDRGNPVIDIGGAHMTVPQVNLDKADIRPASQREKTEEEKDLAELERQEIAKQDERDRQEREQRSADQEKADRLADLEREKNRQAGLTSPGSQGS